MIRSEVVVYDTTGFCVDAAILHRKEGSGFHHLYVHDRESMFDVLDNTPERGLHQSGIDQ
jgi:hypothetical protein